jgi:hypothetical protein
VLLLAGCGSGGGETGGSGTPGDRLGVPVESLDFTFDVENTSSQARRETVCVSVPFPEGRVWDLGDFGVPDHQTAWLPLQRWTDESIRVAQAQFTADLPANQKTSFQIVAGTSAANGGFAQHPWVAARGSNLRIGARVHDTFGHAYEAEISGAGEELQATRLIRVRRWHLYHESTTGGGIGRDYLTSTFYVTDYRDTPFVVVDWIFGNDYRGIDDTTGLTDPNWFPLGPVDVNDVSFAIGGADDVQPYLQSWHQIEAAVAAGDGRSLYRVMASDWIGEGQTRRYRFLVRIDDPNASAGERTAWANRFEAFRDGPARSLLNREAWTACKAPGLLAGPCAGPENAAYRADAFIRGWLGLPEFSTWGSFGDVKGTNTTGTPRNGPLGQDIGYALQSGDFRLLLALEQKAWAQAQRPYHLWQLEVGSEEDIMLWDGVPLSLDNRWARELAPQSLGRRALRANDPWAAYRTRITVDGDPHGWNPFDIGHWTTDLLYEHWTLTGDEWCREEMRVLAECIRGTMHHHGNYASSVTLQPRGEGWIMWSLVQCYLATGDERLKEFALLRASRVVDRDRLKDHPSKALRADGPDPRSRFPGNDYTWFFTWQHGAVMQGYAAAYKFFDEPLFLEIAEDCVDTIAYSSVSNYTDPTTNWHWVLGIRWSTLVTYEGQYVPVTHLDSVMPIPMASSERYMLLSGLFGVSELTGDAVLAEDARRRGRLFQYVGQIDDRRWDKWHFTVPEDSIGWIVQ